MVCVMKGVPLGQTASASDENRITYASQVLKPFRTYSMIAISALKPALPQQQQLQPETHAASAVLSSLLGKPEETVENPTANAKANVTKPSQAIIKLMQSHHTGKLTFINPYCQSLICPAKLGSIQQRIQLHCVALKISSTCVLGRADRAFPVCRVHCQRRYARSSSCSKVCSTSEETCANQECGG